MEDTKEVVQNTNEIEFYFDNEFVEAKKAGFTPALWQTVAMNIRSTLYTIIDYNALRVFENELTTILQTKTSSLYEPVSACTGIQLSDEKELYEAIEFMKEVDLHDFDGEMTCSHIMLHGIMTRYVNFENFGISENTYVGKVYALKVEHLSKVLSEAAMEDNGHIKIPLLVYNCGLDTAKAQISLAFETDGWKEFFRKKGASLNRMLGYQRADVKYEEAVQYACEMWDEEDMDYLHDEMAEYICKLDEFSDLKAHRLKKKLHVEARKRNKRFGDKGVKRVKG